MDFLKGLNAQQREAVTQTEGPLLILAGAGSGKTRVITHRIAYIITQRHVPPSAILAVTFTNKAAGEMRERVAGLLEDVRLDSAPNIFTFHSFCVRLLRRDGDGLSRVRPGFTRRFSIYDDEDQLGIIKSGYRGLGLDEKEFLQYRVALSRISAAKNRKETPEDLFKAAVNKESEALAKLYQDYEKSLRNANALDFDDLLLEAVRLLQTDQPTREAWNRRLSYVLVDEYQDTNRSQYELMRLLSQEHNNLCVVGDEDQSIYSWRGADIRNILDFERDFPKARIIRLEQNYRSTKNILAAAGAVVENNKARKGKKLWTEEGAGELLGLYAGHDSENEALFIADTIEKHLVANPGDQVAVLYRTNSQSRQIEEALRRYGRKYNVVGGFSFYQRSEIKDTVAYLKLASSNTDSVSLLRVINTPARGIGRTTVEQIEKFAREQGLGLWDAIERMIDDQSLSTRSQSSLVAFRNLIQELSLVANSSSLPELLRHILERTGYKKMLEQERTPEAETRLENLDELLNAAEEAAERGETMARFPGPCRAGGGSRCPGRAAQVVLMTLHNAKGLEFPVVFLVGNGAGPVPAQPVDGFGAGARRGAAAVLRGHDAGAQAADPHLGQVPPALWRWRAGALHAVMVSGRGATAPDCGFGSARRAGRDRPVRRASGRTTGGAAQHLHRQDLQFAREHFAILRRPGQAVRSQGAAGGAGAAASAASRRQSSAGQAASGSRSAGSAGRAHGHGRRASQVRHGHGGAARRRRR